MTVRILLGDVREQLKTLADDSIDCAVTSPPYWGLRSYLPDDHPDKPKEIGLERKLGDHLDVLVDVFREMRRVMKPSAPFWLNYGDCYANDGKWGGETGGKQAYLGDANRKRVGREKRITGLKPKDLCLIPFRLAIALQEDGWWVRSRCMWGKPNGMPDSAGKYRPSVAHEEIFLLGKSGDVFYDHEAVAGPVSGSTHARVSQNVAAQKGSTRANGGRKTNGNMKAVVRGRAPGVTPKSADEDTNVRAKGSFHASTTEIVDTRYLRTYEPEVWHIATAAYAEAHFATFPPALVERCLMAGLPKDRRCVVLDPFGGAGTVGLVADRMGHDAVLIDIHPEYGQQQQRRIHGDAPLFADVQTTEAA